jgi:hypothetical protein
MAILHMDYCCTKKCTLQRPQLDDHGCTQMRSCWRVLMNAGEWSWSRSIVLRCHNYPWKVTHTTSHGAEVLVVLVQTVCLHKQVVRQVQCKCIVVQKAAFHVGALNALSQVQEYLTMIQDCCNIHLGSSLPEVQH